MIRWKLVIKELVEHVPFTILGAVTGIIIMGVIVFLNVPRDISDSLFYILHPIHVVMSAVATTSMYKLWGKGKLLPAILIGYSGSIGVATLSDAVIPYLGGTLLDASMDFHIPFIETAKMPVIGIAKWQVVNSGAALGIAIGYWKPVTKHPHAGHVLLSIWASLFNFTAFGTANWLPLLPFVFAFLFLAVWLPCCLSDIVYPLLFARRDKKPLLPGAA